MEVAVKVLWQKLALPLDRGRGLSEHSIKNLSKLTLRRKSALQTVARHVQFSCESHPASYRQVKFIRAGGLGCYAREENGVCDSMG